MSQTPLSIPAEQTEFLGYASDFDGDAPALSPAAWWGSSLVLVLITFIAYSHVIGLPLLWNDHARLADDMRLRSPVGLGYEWKHPLSGPSLPVGETLFWIETHVIGINHPLGFHGISFLLLAASALLLRSALRRLHLPLSGWISAGFAVHPVTIGAVALAANQPLLLCLIFSLIALIGLLRLTGVDPADIDDDGIAHVRPWTRPSVLFALVLLFQLAAIATHPLAWLFPAAMLAEVLLFATVLHPVSLRKVVALSLATASGLIVSVFFLRAQLTHSIGPQWANVLLIPKILALSAWRAIVPSPGYLDPLSTAPLTAFGMAALIGWLVALAWGVRRWRAGHPAALLIVSLLTLFAAGAALSAGREAAEIAVTPAALLPALLTILTAALTALHHLWRHRKTADDSPLIPTRPDWLTRIAAAVVIGLAAAAFLQTGTFADEPAAWARLSDSRPASALLANARAASLAAAEQSADGLAGDRLDEAIAEYARVLSLYPANRTARIGQAQCLARQKKFDAAIDLFRQAVTDDPTDAALYDGESQMYAAKGIGPQVRRLSQRALELNPADPIAHNDLALQLDTAGDLDAAALHYGQAIALDPLFCAPRINLATVWFTQGKLSEASDQLVEVTRIDPHNFQAYANVGAMLAAVKQWPRAEQMLRSALSIKADSKEVWQNLAIVLQNEGKTTEARYIADKSNELVR